MPRPCQKTLSRQWNNVPQTELETRFTAPDGWQWDYFNCPDRTDFGHKIRYGYCMAKNPKGVAVIASGRTQTAEEYFEFTRDLLNHGFSVAIMDWQGQGGSYRFNNDNTRHHSNGFDNDVRDFELFLQKIKSVKALANLPQILFAHSMGGNITLHHMAEYQPPWQCAMMIAPMIDIKIPALLKPLAGTIIRTVNKLGRLASYAPGFKAWSPITHKLAAPFISSDPVRRDIQRYWFENHPELQCGGVTYGWLQQALKSIKALKHSTPLQATKSPILFATAARDAVVVNNATIKLADKISSAKAVSIEKSQHCILMERDDIRDVLKAYMDAFIEKHLHLAQKA